ncbi:unnamed protein product [Leptosia nina]|uniref:Odorant receptor n=1 Tax=Leptosia nina TaxID=320188 RepID=A0AAV1JPL7_9NEOP
MKSNLPSLVETMSQFLRLLVLNIDKRNTKIIWFVFWHCAETGEKITAIVVFSLGVASEIAAYKLIFMYLYSDAIQDIVEDCLLLDAEISPASRMASNFEKHLSIVKRRATIFWCFICCNGILYVGEPILLPGRHLMEDDFILFGLDPIFESPNYEIAFTACALGVFFTCYLTSNISMFFVVMTGYIEAQLLSLSEELTNIWDDAKEEMTGNCSLTLEDNRAIDQFIQNRLIDIFKSHTACVDLAKRVDAVLNRSIGTEFLLLVISLIAELLGGLENTYLELPFALIQVTMDCIMGQRLIDACDAFSDAVYFCKWENFNAKNSKIVLLMLTNAQKTLSLSAGGIATLSFVCLMSVLRSIFSAYTTLGTVVH